MAPRSRVPAVLVRAGGHARRADVARATSPSAVSRALASGAVIGPVPGWLALPAALDDPRRRRRLALDYAGPQASLSHLTALEAYRVPVPGSDAVHVLLPHGRQRRTVREHPLLVQVHRSRAAVATRTRDGMRVVAPATAVVQTWPLLTGSDQRAPALTLLGRNLMTPSQLAQEVARHPQAEQVADLGELAVLLAAGCRSELELWGYTDVFVGPELASLRRQVEVVVQGRTMFLDGYDEAGALALELDGRQYHDSPQQRERDLARDRLLATAGILTARFPHLDLRVRPQACREEALRIMRRRRTQLAAARLPRVVTEVRDGVEHHRLLP